MKMMLFSYSNKQGLSGALSSFFFIHILIQATLFAQLANAESLISTIANNPDLAILTELIVNNTELVDLYSNVKEFTLLAPTNDALRTWLNKKPRPEVVEATLRYHLLKNRLTTLGDFEETPKFVSTHADNETYYSTVTNGQVVGIVTRNGQQIVTSGNYTESVITTSDILARGGFIQVISRVLELPSSLIPSISQSNLGLFAAILNAGDLLSEVESPFLVTVLRASDLTVFAPNTEQALKDMNSLMTGLNQTGRASAVGYHLVPKALYSGNLTDGMKLKTLAGQDLTVTVMEGEVYINSAKIITSNLLISNGVIHTIDNLLDAKKPNPPTKPVESATPTTSAAPVTSTTPAQLPNNAPSSSGLSTGVKAGIAVGAIAVAIVAVALLILFFRRRKSSGDSEKDAATAEFDRQMSAKSIESSEAGGTRRIRVERPIGVVDTVRDRSLPPQIPPQDGVGNDRENDEELEARRTSGIMPVQNIQKQWVYSDGAVELDGSAVR